MAGGKVYPVAKKVATQLDLVIGQLTRTATLQEVANKHDIAKSTAQTWWEEIKDRLPATLDTEQIFNDALQRAAVSMVEAHEAPLALIRNEDWLKTKLAKDGGDKEILNIIVTLSNNLIAIGRATGAVASPAPALESRPTLEEQLADAELSDDEDS